MPTSSLARRLDVKAAARIAIKYLHELMPTIPLSDITLEEVEMSGNTWLVTLGYSDKNPSSFARVTTGGRTFKRFQINAATGEVISMRMRKPE